MVLPLLIAQVLCVQVGAVESCHSDIHDEVSLIQLQNSVLEKRSEATSMSTEQAAEQKQNSQQSPNPYEWVTVSSGAPGVVPLPPLPWQFDHPVVGGYPMLGGNTYAPVVPTAFPGGPPCAFTAAPANPCATTPAPVGTTAKAEAKTTAKAEVPLATPCPDEVPRTSLMPVVVGAASEAVAAAFKVATAPAAKAAPAPSPPAKTPVDCQVSSWMAWTSCQYAQETRTRTIVLPQSHGGKKCPILEDAKSCSAPETKTQASAATIGANIVGMATGSTEQR